MIDAADKEQPSISVITISLNSERYIEDTIVSVQSQSYSNLEYLVIDGGSRDGTLNIIERYAHGIDKWISAPDEGIADAMNKGIAMASGEYLMFLHSDDYLLNPDSLSSAAALLDRKVDVAAFSLYLDYGDRKVFTPPQRLRFLLNLKAGIRHQAALCRRELFERIGWFDKQFKICMDYDFFLRAHRAGAAFRNFSLPISVMRTTGISSQRDRDSLRMRFREEKRVHEKNVKGLGLRLLYWLYWNTYPLYRGVPLD